MRGVFLVKSSSQRDNNLKAENSLGWVILAGEGWTGWRQQSLASKDDTRFAVDGGGWWTKQLCRKWYSHSLYYVDTEMLTYYCIWFWVNILLLYNGGIIILRAVRLYGLYCCLLRVGSSTIPLPFAWIIQDACRG